MARGRKAVRADDKRLKANRPPPMHPKTRYQMLLDGDIKVEDLDDEEIRRGRCRDKHGGFSGRPPSVFPRQLNDALHNEFIKRTNESFMPDVEVARSALVEIVQNRRAAAPARVRAAEVLLERGAGKVTDKVHQTVEVKKYETVIAGLLVDIEDEK